MTALAESPLSSWLCFTVRETSDGRIYAIAPGDAHVGNPLIKALHGGIVSTFLEIAAHHELHGALPPDGDSEAININVDYLKSAKLAPLFARARIAKIGRRLAFVDCIAWQESEDNPVAKAACSFCLVKSAATSLAGVPPAPRENPGGAFFHSTDGDS
ncbi:MAG: PaaI family thioesterase [Amphiplicatus sp.]